MKALLTLGVLAYGVAVWLLLTAGGATAFLLALAIGTGCLGVAALLRAPSQQAEAEHAVAGSEAPVAPAPAEPVQTVQPVQTVADEANEQPFEGPDGGPDGSADGSALEAIFADAEQHESPLHHGDPATADSDLADLNAAVLLLRTCSPSERERIEAANQPVGVEDIADALEGAGIDEYADAHAAWVEGGMVGPAPGVQPDLAQAARDILALRDGSTP